MKKGTRRSLFRLSKTSAFFLPPAQAQCTSPPRGLEGTLHWRYSIYRCRPSLLHIMAICDVVSDPSLLPVLRTSAETQAQCQKLLSMLDPASAPSSPAESERARLAVSKQQKLLFALLAQLRGQNRDAILRVRETKQATAEARQEIDRLHLQLQNLYYEQKHLMGEITACESYDHKYLALPLIPVEEFFELFPQHRESSEHELMIARINHEHAEREKLEQARQELLKRKQALIAENNKRKEDLANLDQDLERFIDAAKPIQKTFEKEY